MGLRDKHDSREQGFQHYAKLAADGTVLAIIEVIDDATVPPLDTPDGIHIPITDLFPYDLTDAKISAKVSHKPDVKERHLFAIRAKLRAQNKANRGG